MDQRLERRTPVAGDSLFLLLLATVAAGPLLSSSGFLNTRGGGEQPVFAFPATSD